MTDITQEGLLNVKDELIKSCLEKHLPHKDKVLFSAKNYDILEKNLKEPLLTRFKEVGFRCKDMS